MDTRSMSKTKMGDKAMNITGPHQKYEASGAAYASTLPAPIHPILGSSTRKGSSSGRRADSDMSGDPASTNVDK